MKDLSRLIFKSFKAKGLSISADATEALIGVLRREDEVEGSLNLILDELTERIEKQEIKSSIIDVTTITDIVAELSSSEEDLANESLQLLDAFNSPKIFYDEKYKTFKVIKKPDYQLLGGPESRANMYRERLLLTQQRLLRSGEFVLKGMSNSTASRLNEANAVHELSTIESLLGSTGIKVLFGMLTSPEEGSWFLEDLGSIIRLDLSKVQTYHLFFTEGSHVVLEGELINSIFRVYVMGLPPAEERSASLKAIGDSEDVFGNDTRPSQRAQLKQLEEQATDMLIVILSDVQLDKPHVLEKLQVVFEGFENNGIDPLFIIMGSFISKPISRTVNGRAAIRTAFSALADVIERCPRICQQGKFLLVPGPYDAGSSVALPRRAIPEEMTENIRSRVRHVTFASNPSRVRFYTQEIVLFREDLLRKMQRHLVVPLTLNDQMNTSGGISSGNSSTTNNSNKKSKNVSGIQMSGVGDDEEKYEEEDDEETPAVAAQGPVAEVPDITEQLVESILDQGHLFPLPLQAKPIYWDLDYTLRLFPLPDLLVLADHCDHYEYNYKKCLTVNPGSFSSDFSFIVYIPATKTVQFSKAP